VWDYPRPPRLERDSRRVRVVAAGETIAETTAAWRVLETSHPPTFYLPREDVDLSRLRQTDARTWCEFKGAARYFDVIGGAAQAAWTYEEPTPRFVDIAGHVCFYPSRVEACFVGDERVRAQEGDFYGGWITAEIVGPFKGGPGTAGW